MQPRFDRMLADEIIADCQRRGKDPYVEYLHIEVLDRVGVLEAWTTEYVRAYIDSGMKRKNNPGLLSENELVAANAAVGLLEQYFYLTREQGLTIYEIIDHKHRIVAPCICNKEIEQVSHKIRNDLWGFGMVASKRLTGHLLDLYCHNGPAHPKPVLWAQRDEDVWCLGRALVEPDASVPFPHIQTVLDRLSDDAAVGAWLWGVYSGQYQGRQMLYISDTTGEAGKSSFARAFEALFNLFEDPADGVIKPADKARITASLNWNILKDSSHASSHFDGKRFVWIGDNKNPNVLMSQAVKELSGDDLSMLNPKGLPAYSTYLEANLLVLANVEPNITSERHNLSRTLWVKLLPLDVPEDQIDKAFADHYAAEMPGFLAWARRCYEDRCTKHTKIRVNAAVLAAIDLKVHEFEDDFAAAMSEHFALDPKGALTAVEYATTMALLKFDRHQAANFKTWLERQYKQIIKSKGGTGGWTYHGVRTKTPRDRYGGKDGLMESVQGQGFTMKPVRHPWASSDV